MKFHTISYRYCCAHSEGSGFKWFMHPVISFWLSGAGGGFEENLKMRTAVVDWSVRGQIQDQEESRQGGPGAMKCIAWKLHGRK